MTGIQDDIATLRWSVERLMYAEGIKAVGRVEDEIARLREGHFEPREIEILRSEFKAAEAESEAWKARALEAEARQSAAEAERDNWKASCARYLAARQAAEAEVQRLKKIVGEA